MTFESKKRRYIVICVLAATFIAYLLMHIRESRERAREAARANLLRLVRMYLFDHNSRHSSFPKPVSRDNSGLPLASWRLIIFREERNDPAVDVLKAWNELPNLHLVDRGPPMFCRHEDGLEGTNTSVFAIDDLGGPFHVRRKRVPGSTAIAIWIETSCGHVWSAPGDAQIKEKFLILGTCAIEIDNDLSCLVVFADNEVWRIQGKQGFEWAFRFADMEYAEKVRRDDDTPSGCVRVK